MHGHVHEQQYLRMCVGLCICACVSSLCMCMRACVSSLCMCMCTSAQRHRAWKRGSAPYFALANSTVFAIAPEACYAPLVHVHVHARALVHTHVHVRVNVRVNVHVRVCVHVHVRVNVHVHVHVHVHAKAFSFPFDHVYAHAGHVRRRADTARTDTRTSRSTYAWTQKRTWMH